MGTQLVGSFLCSTQNGVFLEFDLHLPQPEKSGNTADFEEEASDAVKNTQANTEDIDSEKGVSSAAKVVPLADQAVLEKMADASTKLTCSPTGTVIKGIANAVMDGVDDIFAAVHPGGTPPICHSAIGFIPFHDLHSGDLAPEDIIVRMQASDG